MGTIPPRLPVRHEDYLEGLKHGRDLYAEDLARYEREIMVMHIATFIVITLGLIAASMFGFVALL
jgi:hypothetical protein